MDLQFHDEGHEIIFLPAKPQGFAPNSSSARAHPFAKGRLLRRKRPSEVDLELRLSLTPIL